MVRSSKFPLGNHSTGIAFDKMSSTFLETTTSASTSYFLQLATTAHHNSTRTLFIPPPVFQQDSGNYLTPEEEYFRSILMKYQPNDLAPRARLISVSWSATLGAFFIISTLFGLIGNTCVIIAIAGDKVMRRSAMNILLLNLAVADMLNLIIIVLEWYPAVVFGFPAWDLPAFLCPLTRFLECTFLFASILTQLGVCIERYVAIVFPIHVRRLATRQNILILAIVIWLAALIFSLPYALVHVKPRNSIKCVNPHSYKTLWVLYKWFEFLTVYAIPCTIMIFLYARVAAVLWSKNTSLGTQRPSALLHADDKTRFEVLDMRRGIIKMLVACVLVYFVAYSPIQGIFIMTAMFGAGSRPPYSVILLLNAFAVTCSAANPILYTLFSKKFRMRILHLLSCGKHGKTYKRNDITYSFAKRPKHKSRSLEPDHSALLHNSLTPNEDSSRRFVTLTSNSPM
ncbi:Neuropeptide receptor 15 [Aphelenchoides bicaudatus]|nr:Neuropeptide receptor 15 [Aphelenchoides bicaudatus]